MRISRKEERKKKKKKKKKKKRAVTDAWSLVCLSLFKSQLSHAFMNPVYFAVFLSVGHCECNKEPAKSSRRGEFTLVVEKFTK